MLFLAAASFGAALTSLYSAPELNAGIIDIQFSPDTLDIFAGTYQTNGAPAIIDFPNVTFGSYPVIGGNAGVGAFNDSFGVFINNDGVSQLALVEAGDFFTNGTAPYLSFASSETGVRYIGFVAGGSVGWFSVDLGTTNDDALEFTGGQFLVIPAGTPFPDPFGITVGVPEPSSAGLTALALGAIGLRRRRKAAA